MLYNFKFGAKMVKLLLIKKTYFTLELTFRQKKKSGSDIFKQISKVWG